MEEVVLLSSKTSTSAPAENKPYKSWASSSNPLGWNAGPCRNMIDQIAWDKENVSAEIQKIWKRNRKNSDNLALLAWGNMAAPFVAIGGAYAAITAPVWAPFAYQTTIQSARFYRTTFGASGGTYPVVGKLVINYTSESISSGSLNPLNHNAISYAIAPAMPGSLSIPKQMMVGASSGLIEYKFSSNKFTGVWNQNPATTTLKVINGATSPFLGNVYGNILRQGIGGYAIDKLNNNLENENR